MDPKVERLAAVPLFASSDKKSLERLASAIDVIEVEEGATLFRHGAVQHEAFVIESGTATVSIDGEIVAEIPQGEMIGEIGLLTRQPASATVVASSPMSLLMIPHQLIGSASDSMDSLGALSTTMYSNNVSSWELLSPTSMSLTSCACVRVCQPATHV